MKAHHKEIHKSEKELEDALEAQQSWLPQDFPPGADRNTVHDIISTFFKDTEFYRRFRLEGDTEWTAKLSQSKAIYNDSQSHYNTLPICLQFVNRVNGYGYRNWRDGQVYYMAEMMSCSVAIHWGWIDICPAQTEGANDAYNVFEILFYNNHNFAASRKRSNALSDTGSYPPLHAFNAAFASRGHLMYDKDGRFINGSQAIIDNANENILGKLHSVKWGEIDAKNNKYDRDLNVVQEVDMLDGDIDFDFAELIGWHGGITV
eukprot:369089_1